MGVSWYVAGVLWIITIIGIPVGKQCFKIGTLCFFPFGKYVLSPSGGNRSFLVKPLMNLYYWFAISYH